MIIIITTIIIIIIIIIINNNKDFYSTISVGSWRFTTEYLRPKIL